MSPSRWHFVIQPARNSAHEIKSRQRVHKAQQIPHDNLIELKPHPLHVHHAQPQQSFADGLPAPRPFEENSVSDADDKIANDVKRNPKIEATMP